MYQTSTRPERRRQENLAMKQLKRRVKTLARGTDARVVELPVTDRLTSFRVRYAMQGKSKYAPHHGLEQQSRQWYNMHKDSCVLTSDIPDFLSDNYRDKLIDVSDDADGSLFFVGTWQWH